MVHPQNSESSLSSTGDDSSGLAREVAEAAALGVLVKINRRKRFLIRAFETVTYPFVRALDRLGASPARPGGEVRKILVVEYWNLGDIVMLSPFLQNLRIHFPSARITLMTNPKVMPLLENQGLVDEVTPVQVPWAQHHSRWSKYNPFTRLWLELVRSLKLLRRERFDMGFAGRPDVRDNFILWLARARRRVGYAFAGGGLFLTEAVTPDLDRPHFADKWLRLIEHLGKPVLVRHPCLKIGAADAGFAQRYLAERGICNGELIVGIHPGARIPTRQWGEYNFLEVARRLLARFSAKILWFEDPGQNRLAGEVPGLIPVALPLRQFLAVLARCRLLVCNDSGPMHLATAVNVPVVPIFGPGDPAWFGPLGEQNKIVIRDGFWCRPCFDYCIFDQPYCLRAVTPDRVFEAASEVMSRLDDNGSLETKQPHETNLRTGGR